MTTNTYLCLSCGTAIKNPHGFIYCPYCATPLQKALPTCSSHYPVKVIVGWEGPNHPIFETRHECWGTKERLYCNCGGDPSKCDFYPEKRSGWHE